MLRDVPSSSDAPIFIGKTLFRDKNSKFTRLTPLAEASGTEWRPIANARTRFPEAGLVFCVDPVATSAPEGTYLLFRIARNDRHEPGRTVDANLAVDVCEPYEILKDFISLSPGEQRRMATVDGIRRSQRSPDKVVLPLKGNLYVMPRLVSDHAAGVWRIHAEQRLEKLPTHIAERPFDGGMSIGEGRWFALPGTLPGKVVGAVNWQFEVDFAETLVKFVRRSAQDAELANLTRKAQDRLRGALQGHEAIVEGAEEDRALKERLSGFLANLDERSATTEAIVRSLTSAGAIKTAAERVSASEIERLKSEVAERTELETRIKLEAEEAELRRELRLAVRDLEMTRESVAKEQDILEDTVERRRRAFEELRQDVSAFVEGIARRSEGMMAINQIAVDLGVMKSDGGKSTPSPWATIPTSAVAETFPLRELADRLGKASLASGYPVEWLMQVDIAVRAGDVPLIVGPGCDDLIACYAGCVTAGGLHRHVLDPSVIGPDDLWTHPSRPGRQALEAAWREAEANPARVVLLLLDRVDRANLSDWFSPFARLFRNSRPANLLALATADTVPEWLSSGVMFEAPNHPNAVARLAIGAPGVCHGQLLMDDDGLPTEGLGPGSGTNPPDQERAERWRGRLHAASAWHARRDSAVRLIEGWAQGRSVVRVRLVTDADGKPTTISEGERA